MDDFAEFFAATRDGAYRAVFAATGTRTGAEDAVAEAYARGYANWAVLSEHPEPVAWILRTALNTHRSLWRRLRREVLGEAPPDRAGLSAEPSSLDGSVRAAVAALPRRQREVLALRVLADLSAEQTGGILGLAPSTVHVHLHRALAALRKRLTDDGRGVDGRAAVPAEQSGGVDMIEFTMGRVVRLAY